MASAVLRPGTSPVVAAAEAGYRSRYGCAPAWVAVAPGRVNLMGDHTDYNAGLALPFAIPHCVVVAGGPAGGGSLRAYSEQDPQSLTLALGPDPLPRLSGWGAYVAGTVQALRNGGHAVPPVNLYCAADLPPGAGLSSSAALAVGLLQVLQAAANVELSAATHIAMVQYAERHYADVPCGILDPFAILHGRADTLLLLDCASATAAEVAWPATGPHGAAAIIIVDSGVTHSNAAGGYAARRSECEAAAQVLGRQLGSIAPEALAGLQPLLDAELYPRVRHVVTECARVRATAGAFARADWPAAGAALDASHKSLRDDFAVTCPETDALVAAAAELGSAAGVWGARMTGGGFGGAVLVLAQAAAADTVRSRLQTSYRQRCGRDARCWVVRPAAGARLL